MNLLDIHFWSDSFEMQTRMKVLLPDRMNGEYGHDLFRREEPDYGALYLLHGMDNGYGAWTRWTSIERYAAGHNLAVIMPEASLGWYTDMKFGFPYFTFLTEELPTICRNFFPHLSRRREDTFVGGISMGGYGAMRCALNRPDLFAGAGVFAGGLDIAKQMDDPRDTPEERQLYRDIFGTPEEFRGSDSDLFAQVDKRAGNPQKTSIFACCGTRDRFYDANVRMRDLLRADGWKVSWTEGDAGHDFGWWDSLIPAFLAWIDGERRGH